MKTSPRSGAHRSSPISCVEPLEARIAPASVASINLADLDVSNGFKLSGVADGDKSVFNVGTAGDVNGYGFSYLMFGP